MSQSNKLETMDIKKLVRTTSLPLMVSMLVQSLYNIVDSIFVSSISNQALTATSLAYPVEMLMISLAIGIGVGINALLSRVLGTKNTERAKQVIQSGYLQACLSTCIFVLLGLLFSKSYVSVFSNDLETIELGTLYLRVCTVGSFGIFLSTTGERILQATGYSIYSMFSQMLGAVLNIILDAIFILIFDLGVLGAALATIISQWISGLFALYLNKRINKALMKKMNIFAFHQDIIKTIYKIGIPTMVMQLCGSIMIFSLNNIFKEMGNIVAVFNIYFKFWTFLFMPVSGLAQGLLPIVGYNYGAKNYDRVKRALSYTLKIAILIMLTGSVIFISIPDLLLKPYHLNTLDLTLAKSIFRSFGFAFVFSGISVTIGFYFSALGNGFVGMIATLIRQVIIPIPLMMILVNKIDIYHIWWIFIISEICSAGFTLYKLKKSNLSSD